MDNVSKFNHLTIIQGDLSEEDVMLLDNGKQVYVWFGKAASEVEKKLAVKSAQVCW